MATDKSTTSFNTFGKLFEASKHPKNCCTNDNGLRVVGKILLASPVVRTSRA